MFTRSASLPLFVCERRSRCVGSYTSFTIAEEGAEVSMGWVLVVALLVALVVGASADTPANCTYHVCPPPPAS